VEPYPSKQKYSQWQQKETKHVTNIKGTTRNFPSLCALIQTSLQIDVFNVHCVNSLKLS